MWEEDVGLEEGGDGLEPGCAYGDAERVGEGGSLEGFHFRGHSCREEKCSSFAREDFEDFVYDGAEIEVQEAIGFVNY